MTVSVNHTPEFWDNFKFVLKECQGKGIYLVKDPTEVDPNDNCVA